MTIFPSVWIATLAAWSELELIVVITFPPVPKLVSKSPGAAFDGRVQHKPANETSNDGSNKRRR